MSPPPPGTVCALFLSSYLAYNIPIVFFNPYLRYLLSFQAVLELKPFWQEALASVVINVTSDSQVQCFSEV